MPNREKRACDTVVAGAFANLSRIPQKAVCLLLCRSGSPTATLRLFFHRLVFDFHSGQFRVYHDTAAVFAYDNLLAHTNIQLALGGDFIETATASIALHVNDTQSVAAVLTDTLECQQQTGFYGSLQFFGSFAQLLFLRPCFGNNVVQL